MSTFKIILNPIAGKGTALKAIPVLEQKLNQLGVDYDIVLTERPGHAIGLAGEAVAEGCEVVVAAGGDGTVNEVINGLMLAKKNGIGKAGLAVLPIGRGNDFAASMRIPTDLMAACERLAVKDKKPIDIGLVTGELYPQGRYFGNGVGIGFDAVVGFVAAKLKLTGMLAYLVAAIRTMRLYFNAPTLQIELDNETITIPAIMTSIMNGRRMGGSFWMAPDSINSDGLLDLCIVQQISRSKMLTIFPMVMKGTQAQDSAVKTTRSRCVTVTAISGTLPAHADGETLCTEGHKLVIELLPGELDLVS